MSNDVENTLNQSALNSLKVDGVTLRALYISAMLNAEMQRKGLALPIVYYVVVSDNSEGGM